jgi:biopolymer transport protein ExbB
MNLMDLLWVTIIQDWFIILIIFIPSIATVAVAYERLMFYNKNRRDIPGFIGRLQRELAKGSLDNAQMLSSQLGGIVGEVAEEGVRQLNEQSGRFNESFDITISLATRSLERNLPVLGTIGGVAPFLGLLGTVLRILITFGELGTKGNASAEVAFGIGSALIATAFGLAVAIVAVICYNWFNSIVNRYVDDFQLLKLVFLSFAEQRETQPLVATQ